MKGLAVFTVFAVIIIIGVFFIRAREGTPTLPPSIETPATTSTQSEIASSSNSISDGAGSSTASTTDLSWTKDFTTITTADVDKTFSFSLHTRFLLKLGGDRTVTFNPADLVGRVPNSINTDGYEGVYEALKVGTTTLTAKNARKTFTAIIVVTSN